jgi:hypothetical protein
MCVCVCVYVYVYVETVITTPRPACGVSTATVEDMDAFVASVYRTGGVSKISLRCRTTSFIFEACAASHVTGWLMRRFIKESLTPAEARFAKRCMLAGVISNPSIDTSSSPTAMRPHTCAGDPCRILLTSTRPVPLAISSHLRVCKTMQILSHNLSFYTYRLPLSPPPQPPLTRAS